MTPSELDDLVDVAPQRALLAAWAREYVAAIAAKDESIAISPWPLIAAYQERLDDPEQGRRTHVAQLRAWMADWTAAGAGWHVGDGRG